MFDDFDYNGNFPYVSYYEDNPAASDALGYDDGMIRIASDIANGMGVWFASRGLNLLSLHCTEALEEITHQNLPAVTALFQQIGEDIEIPEIAPDIQENMTEIIDDWVSYIPE